MNKAEDPGMSKGVLVVLILLVAMMIHGIWTVGFRDTETRLRAIASLASNPTPFVVTCDKMRFERVLVLDQKDDETYMITAERKEIILRGTTCKKDK